MPLWHIRNLGLTDYLQTYTAMQDWVAQARPDHTFDELWITEHSPVFTAGPRSGPQPDDIQDIPVVSCNRGGLMTYHGPGQLILYPLLYLPRTSLSAPKLVTLLENVTLATLREIDIQANTLPCGRGVFVEGRKIASIGLRVKRNWSFHGLALNVSMDLKPFSWITPCGLEGMNMTQVHEFRPDVTLNDLNQRLSLHIGRALGYTGGPLG